MSVYGNMIGGASGLGKTFIFEDEEGNNFTGVVSEKLQIFNAKPSDVKLGKVFASDGGIRVGESTKTYRVRFESYLIFPGEEFSIPLEHHDAYDCTKFYATISVFNTTEFDSTSVEKIVICDSVCDVGSINKLSDISRNATTKSIDLHLTNDTNNIYIINYSMYKGE